MRRAILCTIICLIGTLAIQAQTPGSFVTVNSRQYTVHQVQAGETFYSIAKRYSVEADSLKKVNRLEDITVLKPGEMLIIPLYAIDKPAVGTISTPTPDNCTVHIVKTGETLYSIARQYPHTSVKEIKTVNKLTSDTVNIGQQLFIPKPKGSGMVEPPKPKRDSSLSGSGLIATAKDSVASFEIGEVSDADVDSLDDERMTITAGYDIQMLGDLHDKFVENDTAHLVVTKSAALWLHDENSYNQTKFFALHKSAPIGSILQVRNLMNNRVVYVKVIGKLPDNEETYNVQIQVSAAAARFMNVLDDKFLVEISSHPGQS